VLRLVVHGRPAVVRQPELQLPAGDRRGRGTAGTNRDEQSAIRRSLVRVKVETPGEGRWSDVVEGPTSGSSAGSSGRQRAIVKSNNKPPTPQDKTTLLFAVSSQNRPATMASSRTRSGRRSGLAFWESRLASRRVDAMRLSGPRQVRVAARGDGSRHCRARRSARVRSGRRTRETPNPPSAPGRPGRARWRWTGPGCWPR